MILKTLSLRNFRKFKNAVIEFPDGVIGIAGLNGVGKSTIFEAIAWTLYGPVAARTSADQIKRQGAETSDPCRVELEFIFEDNSYRIVREMLGKSLTAQATATINCKVAATGAETVVRYIQKKLGMDFKSFYTSIFAKQKELNALSNMSAHERRPLILRMLGIDSLDEVVKEIRSDKRSKDVLIDQLDKSIVDENGKDRDEIFKKEIKKLNEKRKEIDEKIKDYKNKINSLKKELKTLEKKYLDNKKNYEKLNEKKEKLSEKKELFEEKNKLENQIKDLTKKIENRDQILAKENKKLDAFKDIEKEIKSVEKKIDKTNSRLEDFVKSIEKNITLVDRTKKDISEIDNKKKDIEKLGPEASCPTCERVLSSQYDNLLKKFILEINNKEKEVKKLNLDIKKTEEEKEIVLREQTALKKKANYLHNRLMDKQRIKTTIKNISSELDNEKKDLKNFKVKLKEIGIVRFDYKEFESIKKQIEQLYSKYQKSLELYNNKKDDISDINLNLEKKDGEKKLIDQEIKNHEEKISEVQKLQKQLKEEKKAINYLGMLSDVMSDFRTHLISRIRPILSSYSSDFFSRLTDGKYIGVELDENYNLMIYDNDDFYGIERFSGGEEDLANLCLRLAISEVITDRAAGVFNFIILDEIFGSQDSFRRQNIMKALNGLSSKFRQIFLITHVEDVQNEMEHIIYVNENVDETSSIKIE
jgi:exonuclease SbcC